MLFHLQIVTRTGGDRDLMVDVYLIVVKKSILKKKRVTNLFYFKKIPDRQKGPLNRVLVRGLVMCSLPLSQ